MKFNTFLPLAVKAFEARAVSAQLVTLVIYVKYLNFHLMINIWEKKRKTKKIEIE